MQGRDDILCRIDMRGRSGCVLRKASAGRRNGFTLIELVVVIGIMILLIAIAAPAVGPAMTSNYRMQVTNALNSSLAMAQTYALSSTTEVAIRVERATELDGYGRVTNRANPKWLDHQQIRFVMMNRSAQVSRPVFEYIKDSKITALPGSVWLAPQNFYTPSDGNPSNDFGPSDFFVPKEPATLDDEGNYGAVGYCPFDTFYIVFSSNGMLKIKLGAPSANPPEEAWYVDDTQKYQTAASPMLAHPQDSASGVLIYERKKLEGAPKSYDGLWNFLKVNAQAMYINRFLGTAVESRQ